MANVFVIGATGGIGKRLCPMLINHNHKVTGLHRSDQQAKVLSKQGIKPAQGDLMEITVDQLTEMTKGHDVLVFTAGAAGSGLNRTAEIDGQGPVKMIQAAINNGIKRVYLVSAFPESARNLNLGESFEYYMKVKKQADVAVANSELDWVIVRPGTLLDEDEDYRVNLGLAVHYGTVKRGNVAAVIAKLVDTPSIKQEILEVTDGVNSINDSIFYINRSR